MDSDRPIRWVDGNGGEGVGRLVDWEELSALYRVAPLGDKPPEQLEIVFTNSMFSTFAYVDDRLVGVGRAMADGADCAYLADVAVHPDLQGEGVGAAIIERLVLVADGHKKIILYAKPGTEVFYQRLGFLPMNTAMAIWHDPDLGVESGVLRPPEGDGDPDLAP
ncbi:MAG: GNAT family N-acetyltransferase [Actinomycetia bacterium]|nr:GNAT family N-acetyltransferase [Actinomycetes bacterium]MCP4228430.1 GNAT family N-acetyltransferase [Actinomycetes bacterium]MCP5034537.1 GNAT family N-acetyltransferase [Actinomycetes bacterium]